jgi:rhodanese-related sulfurtransferase
VSRIDEVLAQARARLARLSAEQAHRALDDGAVLVDIRSDGQRARDGLIPGARVVNRNEFEWRVDPTSDWKDPELARPDARLVIVCNEGYQSSLVAATAQELGIAAATDIDGGFQAWLAAGLPVEREAGD